MLRNRTFKTRLTVTLLMLYTVSILNVVFPFVRFANRIWNMYFVMLMMTIPFVLFAVGVNYKHWFTRFIALISYSTLSLFSMIVIVFILYALSHTAPGNVDTSFQPIYASYQEAYQIKVYKIMGGALTSFGTRIRQEKDVFGGLLIVHDIFYSDTEAEIEVEILPNKIVVDHHEYHLKNNLYF